MAPTCHESLSCTTMMQSFFCTGRLRAFHLLLLCTFPIQISVLSTCFTYATTVLSALHMLSYLVYPPVLDNISTAFLVRFAAHKDLAFQPVKLSQDSGKGPRSMVLGPPPMFIPLLSKQLPWQGQSHCFSIGFHCRRQPRWGQMELSLLTFPASSLYTAILRTGSF